MVSPVGRVMDRSAGRVFGWAIIGAFSFLCFKGQESAQKSSHPATSIRVAVKC